MSYGFEMLYWYGIRGGLLAPADFDFSAGGGNHQQDLEPTSGQDVITSPKTRKSNRTVKMPQFLCDEMQDYLKMFYSTDAEARIFPVSRHNLKHEMARGYKETGVKPIRIHDFRHSHVSLLIDMGFPSLAIAEHVGHESIDITYRYVHPVDAAEIVTRRGSVGSCAGMWQGHDTHGAMHIIIRQGAVANTSAAGGKRQC